MSTAAAAAAAAAAASRPRCGWGEGSPEYVVYHDTEWGFAVADDDALFERLTLEGFQSGLSWLTILRKRENFRAAFAGFEIAAVARFGEADVQRLLADAGIVRNRAKIEAAVSNARAVLDAVPEGLSTLLWSFAPEESARSWDAASWTLRASSPESAAMSKTLKKRGFRFVGPTTCYSLMQAVGMVNDHQPGCWLADPRWSA